MLKRSRYVSFVLVGNYQLKISNKGITQPVITCSKLAIETLEQGVKYVES